MIFKIENEQAFGKKQKTRHFTKETLRKKL